MPNWMRELRSHRELAIMISIDWLNHHGTPLLERLMTQADWDWSWRHFARSCWDETAE